ncbi:MAG: ABC transporter ATP-binding protein [Enterocloster sp.]
MENNVVLNIENLCLTNRKKEVLADHISFKLHRGETLGLVGESGSGKTLTLRSVIGLLPDSVRQTYDVRQISGSCAMIFQTPLSSLDPLCPVFAGLTEIVRIRQKKTRAQARETAEELLKKLSLPEELKDHDRYPHQLSGGQCQRILIAMALACRPDILLCDEPTTALDVTVQKQTLDLICSLQKEMGFAVLFVTHNLAVAANICDSLCVMQHGRIVERGSTRQILSQPQHLYTKVLLESILTVPKR